MGLVNVVNADDIVAGTKPLTDLGVKAIDDKTLEVTLKAPTPWFVKTLAHCDAVRGAQGRRSSKFGTDWTKPENIVGNGAYMLAENSPGERVVHQAQPELLGQRQDGASRKSSSSPSTTKTRA